MSLPGVIATARLTLPLWTAEDVAAIAAGARREGWHADYPRPDDRDAVALWREGDPWGPRHVVRGVTALGSLGCFGPPEAAPDGVEEVEVGIGLVAEARGRGFAREALTGLLDAVARLEPAVRVRAAVEPSHQRSLRMLAACGFTGLRGADEDGRLVMVRPPAS